MACVALISLIRTLELEFLERRPRVVLDDKQHIHFLHERLSLLQALLEESEKKLCGSEAFKDLIPRVKDITSKAEDDIESQVMEIVSMGNQPRSLERLHQVLEILVEDIEGVIECIKKRNIEESYAPQSSNHEKIIVGGSTQRNSKIDEEMVGHAMELARIKEMLLKGSPPERQVLSIAGMGGIGKTTFTKAIYDDLSIRSHFDLYGWTTVSQDHSLRKILHDLCHSIVQMTNDEISNLGTLDLANKLRQCLMGQRYLLVMDDIWDTKVWDDVHRCFPDDYNGSRILLTTRLKEVAYYTGSSKYFCTLPFLNLDESWKLFRHKVSNNEESLPLELEEIGRRIIHKCKGLPLAIVVVAGLLSKTIKSPENWRSVASAINLSTTSNLHEQCSNILTLSYNNLPYHLKACFLYFSVFPEDYEIPTKDLIKLWIAEGFIRADSQRNLEEVANDYLQDLIGRNLVLIGKLSFMDNIKACRIHDLLYDLCLREAKDEKLLSDIHEEIGSSVQLDETQSKCYENGNRWLRFQSWSYLPNFNVEKYTFHKSRTLFFYGHFFIPWTLYSSLKMIRVLDLSLIMFTTVPNFDIEDLILLRYLCVSSIKYLRAMKHHCNLQTLIVEDPNVDGTEDDAGSEWLHGVWKSQNLRYIKYPYHFPKHIDDEDVVQENLQTLYWLPDFQCTKQFVLRIPNVEVLAIRCLEESEFQIQTWWDNLCYLSKLKKLKVCDYCSSTSPLPSINTFPQQLKKLTLVRVLLQWEVITSFSMLPNLEVLKLIRAECMGEKWETIEGGFPKLKFLFISDAELKYWNTTGDHFPVLERLALHYCCDLEEIPLSFADVLTLQLIDLKACTPSLVESARQVHEEQKNLYGYDELIVRDYDTQERSPDDEI